MPPESLWVQYGIVSILIMAAGAIAGAFYKLWHELLSWTETQDNKRQAEREKQRIWQGEQDKVRDLRWQDFLKSMQDDWVLQDGRHTESLKQLISKVDVLIAVINGHDTWSRAKDRP